MNERVASRPQSEKGMAREGLALAVPVDVIGEVCRSHNLGDTSAQSVDYSGTENLPLADDSA
jgi:hypothetical protein